MVITSYHPIVGGAERQVAQLARLMRGAGHDVHVVTRHHAGLAREETVEGVPVHRVPCPGPKAARAAAFVIGAAATLRRLKPDVIHCHSLFAPAIAGRLGAALTGAPLLAKPMCGGEAEAISQKLFGRRRIADLGRHAGRLIAVSSEIARELQGLGVPEDRIRFIPNGVDLDRFRPADAAEKAALRARLGLPDGVLVLFAGRLSAQKRLPLLLGAWPTAAAGWPEAQLLIAGANRMPNAGEHVGDADAIPEAMFSAPRVTRLGHVDDMASLLRAIDVFVLPSAREGLSNALLEACASGAAVIASNVGGTEDLIVPGENGLLFEVDDEAGLARALARLCGDAEFRLRLGAAARISVAARYDIAATAAGLVDQYRELGAGRS
jgi:glycosyltransferase involved in cell wall biosynthesis